jgi:hypothetical protein
VDDIRHPFPVLLFTSAKSTAPVEGIVMLAYKHAYRRKRKKESCSRILLLHMWEEQ